MSGPSGAEISKRDKFDSDWDPASNHNPNIIKIDTYYILDQNLTKHTQILKNMRRIFAEI